VCVCVRRDAVISHSQFRSVLSSPVHLSALSTTVVQLHLTPVHTQAVQCVLWCWLDSSRNGQTTSAQGELDGAHRYRHYRLLHISTKTCTKHVRSEVPGGESSNKKLVQGAFTGCKDGRCVRLTTLPPS
jgi:hypothetical protein